MHDLMKTKMTRLEFLQLLGVTLVSIVGLSRVITLLTQMNQNKQIAYQPTPKAEVGFGTRKFGE
jgi:hypothetical protein